jgi:hypothetical protein
MTWISTAAIIRKPPPRAKTVQAYVDPHARRLVDAINKCTLDARTTYCCSGHYHKPGFPYLAFYSRSWDFVRFLLTAITAANRSTLGYTKLDLTSFIDEREVSGSVRWGVYPWFFRDVHLLPLFTEDVSPPRSLVQLWWCELDELAAMVEQRRTWSSREFVSLFDNFRSRRMSGWGGRRPRWAVPL